MVFNFANAVRHPLFLRCAKTIAAGMTFSVLARQVGSHMILNEEPHASKETPISPQKFQHVNNVVTQAYRDVGFQGPVYVKLTSETYADAANCSFFDDQLKSSALVILERTFAQKASDETLYAVAGHEAVHHHHGHSYRSTALISTAAATLWHYGKMCRLPLWTAIPFVSAFIFRWHERDADLSSAKKLGTSRALADYFRKYEKQISIQDLAQIIIKDLEQLPASEKCPRIQKKINSTLSVDFDFGNTSVGKIRTILKGVNGLCKASDYVAIHPPFNERVQYLEKLTSQRMHSPLLFQSKMWHDKQKAIENKTENKNDEVSCSL
ncbi:MAG: M48 family metalloprotease [Gammaproteobacteria bacterium]|nr:M48 family metalloprotease [Gammaproteobacteria bacterium]